MSRFIDNYKNGNIKRPSTDDLEKELNNMTKSQIIEHLFDQAMPLLLEHFTPEQASTIIALQETVCDVMSSKWFLEKKTNFCCPLQNDEKF